MSNYDAQSNRLTISSINDVQNDIKFIHSYHWHGGEYHMWSSGKLLQKILSLCG